MKDEIRKAFEKHLMSVFNVMVDVEAIELTLKIDNPNQDYKHKAIHEKWVDWQAAVKWATEKQIEKDAEILENGSFLHDKAPDALFAKAAAKAIRNQER